MKIFRKLGKNQFYFWSKSIFFGRKLDVKNSLWYGWWWLKASRTHIHLFAQWFLISKYRFLEKADFLEFFKIGKKCCWRRKKATLKVNFSWAAKYVTVTFDVIHQMERAFLTTRRLRTLDHCVLLGSFSEYEYALEACKRRAASSKYVTYHKKHCIHIRSTNTYPTRSLHFSLWLGKFL